MDASANVGTAEDPTYVINLYTWLADRDAAHELAVRVSEMVGNLPEIDCLATTVSVEDQPALEPEGAYQHLVAPRALTTPPPPLRRCGAP
jgi:hypothetical protein